MNAIERELAVRHAVNASTDAKRALAEIRAKSDGRNTLEHWHDFGVLMAHVALLSEKIDELTMARGDT